MNKNECKTLSHTHKRHLHVNFPTNYSRRPHACTCTLYTWEGGGDYTIPFSLGGCSVAAVSFFLLAGIDHNICCEGSWLRTLEAGRADGLYALIMGAGFSSSLLFCGGVELLLSLESSLRLTSSSCFLILSRMSNGTG